MRTVLNLLPTRLRVNCVLLIAVSIIGAYMASLLPTILGGIIDGFTSSTDNLFRQIAMYGILFLVVETLTIFRRVSTNRLTARFSEEMCNRSLWILLRLPKRELEGSGISGELTSKVNQAVSGASQLLKLITNDVAPTLFLGTFTVWQCIRQSALVFALVMIMYIIVSITVSYLQIKSQKGIRENIIRQKAKFDGEMCQSINGIEQIRALSAERAECQRLAPQTKMISNTECHHHTTMGIYDQIKQAVKVIFICGILLGGLVAISNGKLTGGQIIAVVLLFQQLIKPIDDIYRFLDEISASSIKVRTLKDLMGMKPDEAFEVQDIGHANDYGHISIPHYKVLAPSDCAKVLSQGSNIEFEAGQSTALVAKTGGGKSSLLKGLIRLYPLEGTPEILGIKASAISQNTLTELLHYIPQLPFFFAGSIRDNLAYGLDHVTDTDLASALKQACLYDELAKDGNPLEYLLQESGKPLSGGQLKRMAIARAFLRSPRFYLMDEVFAGIDNGTAVEILNNLDAHAQKVGAGIIHVTHDENVIRRCEKQIELTCPA